MKIIIKILGVLIVLAGIWLLVQPEGLYGWIENNSESTWLYILAITFRLAFGSLLVVAARASKFPGGIKFLGGLAIVAAIAFLLMGQGRFQDFISSMMASFKPFAPVAGLVGIAIGGFLIYAFSGQQSDSVRHN